MECRKIIKFGKNSLIISLPKEWTNSNRLSPGDVVNVTQLRSDLLVSPVRRVLPKTTNDYVFTIDDEDIAITKRKILSAYINICDNITLRGKNLLHKNRQVRDIIHQLVALEIIEESPKRIQAKCYLNMHDINMDNLVRKIDAIIKSMLTDLKHQFHNPQEYSAIDLAKNLSERDLDINRLCYLLMRAVKYVIEHPHENQENRIDATILSRWDVAQILEKVGDEAKRLSRVLSTLSPPALKESLSLLDTITSYYNDIMKAYYRKDAEQAHRLSLTRRKMAEAFENYQQAYGQDLAATRTLRRLQELFYRIDELTTTFD